MSNRDLFRVIDDSVREHAPELNQQKLSVCVGFVLGEDSGALKVYNANDSETAIHEGNLLIKRFKSLVSTGDVTPDCCLTRTHNDIVVGVVIGGQADLTIQHQFATTIAAGVIARYKELC